MPIWYRVDDGVVAVQCLGVVTLRDIVAFIDDREANHLMSLTCLVDATSADAGMTVADVRAVVDRVRQATARGPRGTTVIVTARDASFGMSRMFATLCGLMGAPVEVYRTLEEARRRIDTLKLAASST